MPVFQISGKSMAPKLDNGDLVISIKTKKLNSGDIIAFYHGNKILVKRVIASAGEWVVIDKDGKVYVNGELLREPYIEQFIQGDCDIKFPYQVPAESYFVLGDNRENSADSRSLGLFSKEDIEGTTTFALFPFQSFGFIE
jgi:signal peptidase I